jgi:hypothetical protein
MLCPESLASSDTAGVVSTCQCQVEGRGPMIPTVPPRGDTQKTRRRRWESAHIAYHSTSTATASFFSAVVFIASLESIDLKNWKDSQPPWSRTQKRHSSAVGPCLFHLPILCLKDAARPSPSRWRIMRCSSVFLPNRDWD